jgi:hypothetical protein
VGKFSQFFCFDAEKPLGFVGAEMYFFRTGQPAGTTEADLGLTELMPFDELL